MMRKSCWEVRSLILAVFAVILTFAGFSAQKAYGNATLALSPHFALLSQVMTGGGMTGGDMGMMTGGSAAEEALPPISFIRPGDKDKLPDFPTPLPRATTQSDIYLPDLDDGVSLEDVDMKLREALAELKYPDERKSYYAFPGGYAMAIDVEKFEGNGKFIENDKERWDLDYKVKRGWGKEILAALVNAKVGKYRVIVFVVSDKNFSAKKSDNPVITIDEARDLAVDGEKRLSAELSSKPFTDKHRITVLVYEYSKLYITRPRLLNSSQTSTKVVDHLPVFAAYVN